MTTSPAWVIIQGGLAQATSGDVEVFDLDVIDSDTFGDPNLMTSALADASDTLARMLAVPDPGHLLASDIAALRGYITRTEEAMHLG